jgi:hypothetical protein
MDKKTYSDGVADERKRWHTAMNSAGIRVANRHPYECATVLRYRIECSEELAIQQALMVLKDFMDEDLVDPKAMMETINEAWEELKTQLDEELGEDD